MFDFNKIASDPARRMYKITVPENVDLARVEKPIHARSHVMDRGEDYFVVCNISPQDIDLLNAFGCKITNNGAVLHANEFKQIAAEMLKQYANGSTPKRAWNTLDGWVEGFIPWMQSEINSEPPESIVDEQELVPPVGNQMQPEKEEEEVSFTIVDE